MINTRTKQADHIVISLVNPYIGKDGNAGDAGDSGTVYKEIPK